MMETPRESMATKAADAVNTPLDELHRAINTKWNELQELLDVLALHHKMVMSTLEAVHHMHPNPSPAMAGRV